MKVKKAGLLILVLIMAVQVVAFAENGIQPMGVYILNGTSTITYKSTFVQVSGVTTSFEDVEEIEISLSLMRERVPGVWVIDWSDTKTAYDTYIVIYLPTSVSTQSGYNYRVDAIHSVRHNGVEEHYYSSAQ